MIHKPKSWSAKKWTKSTLVISYMRIKNMSEKVERIYSIYTWSRSTCLILRSHLKSMKHLKLVSSIFTLLFYTGLYRLNSRIRFLSSKYLLCPKLKHAYRHWNPHDVIGGLCFKNNNIKKKFQSFLCTSSILRHFVQVD